MWLIDVETYELKNLTGEHVWHMSPYAILSHTWEQDEVTFEDMKTLQTARQKLGFHKIKNTCKLAKDENLKYAWLDTCCIDKSSSAELQEAINSMATWYSQAKICFAYLGDVINRRDFAHSRWFTRGWTLQELIMPDEVVFLNDKWQRIGTKDSMKTTISQTTGIDVKVLAPQSGRVALGSLSVAKRMSWAAQRYTTRSEDRAYSLLGIFDVSLPLLYGEGTKAFTRLQEEIFRTTADLSLFLWQFDTQLKYTQYLATGNDEKQCLLAPHPGVFVRCGHIKTSATDVSRVATRTLSTVGLAARMSVLWKRIKWPGPHVLIGCDELLLLDCFDERYPQYTIALRVWTKDQLACSPIYTDPEGHNYANRLERVDAMEVLKHSSERNVLLLRSNQHHDTPEQPLQTRRKMIKDEHDDDIGCWKAEPGVDFVWIHSIAAASESRRVHRRKVWPQQAWQDDIFDGTKCYTNLFGKSPHHLFLCGAISWEIEPQDLIVLVLACRLDSKWSEQSEQLRITLLFHDFMSVRCDDELTLKSCCEYFMAETINTTLAASFLHQDHDGTISKPPHILDQLFEYDVTERIVQFGGNDLALLEVRVGNR